MRDSPAALLDDVKAFIARIPKGEEKILAPEYVRRIEAVGNSAFLVEVFRAFSDSELTSWMFRLGSCWKDLSFADWTEVLRQVSVDLAVLYQFVWFASEALAIDVTRLIRSDPAISAAARTFVAQQFPDGGPLPDSPWFHEMLEEHGIDYQAMRSRLGAEGAPMRCA